MALFVNEEEFELLEMAEELEELELSHWEFVMVSDADSEESKEENDENGSGSGSGSPPFEDRIEAQGVDFLHRVDVGDDGYGDHDHDHGYGHDDEDDDDDDGIDDDDEDGSYGLNDELVPWSVSGKFGRERMRKLGKRGFPKMFNSKRSPYLFVRPGVVRGKHGLGLKHSL